MDTTYLEFDFKISPLEIWRDVLIAELGYAGFESFVETEDGFLAYIQKKDWKEDLLDNIEIFSDKKITITHTYKEIEQVNWNEEWEKNYDPIIVENKCIVRASFHHIEQS
nr:50S ribosomal protein L11 methyltransferase [Flavobacteriales bacterium]